jgi:hypothetical protein
MNSWEHQPANAGTAAGGIRPRLKTDQLVQVFEAEYAGIAGKAQIGYLNTIDWEKLLSYD